MKNISMQNVRKPLTYKTVKRQLKVEQNTRSRSAFTSYDLHFFLFFLFLFRACIAIGVLFILSATGIFIRALRSLVVEKHPIRVWRFSSSDQFFFIC